MVPYMAPIGMRRLSRGLIRAFTLQNVANAIRNPKKPNDVR